MTDFPIRHFQSDHRTGKIAAVSVRMIATFRAACGALAQATVSQAIVSQTTVSQAQRGTMRRTPEDILMARTRCEEARRAVERLLR